MARSARKREEPPEELVAGLTADELNNLSVTDLNTLIDRITEVRDQKVAGERADKIKEIQATLVEYGLTPADLERRERKPVAVKYNDPETGTSWSGRGKMPKAFQDRLNEGRGLEEFLVEGAG